MTPTALLDRALKLAASYRQRPGPLEVDDLRRAARRLRIDIDELTARANALGYPIR